jgi:plasmid stabilization system protein ParE
MTVRRLLSVIDETDQEATWYEARQAGLGDAFINALEDSFRFIARHPMIGATVHPAVRGHEVRQYIMRRPFPFSIIYDRVSDDDILIVAVAHHRRRPGYWRSRLSP